MVLSAELVRPYPLAERDYFHLSFSDVSEIKQGLQEISEGKVIPLSQLEEQFGIRKGLS